MQDTCNRESISHNKKINDFFDSQYSWWEKVYDQSLPKKFFSFEMIKRKQLIVDLIIKNTEKDKITRILECGCGPGGIIKELGLLRCQLTGVDINRSHLQRAKNDIEESINWIQSDVESLPFQDGYFDIVYCVGVLSYLKEDKAAVAEMSRVVADGGLVIVSVPNYFMLNKWLDPYYYLIWLPCKFICKMTSTEHAKSDDTNNFGTQSIRRYRYAKINRLFAIHGISAIDTINVSFGPFTLWRKEIFSLETSIKISEMLRKAGEKKCFQVLRLFTNHWITCLTKVSI